ncbi:PD-(D/E)XK nuclease family protein [Candidatus Parcubacteria bacterium]|jgi:hypothetical protein|nr:PD-(D/E)XK nuclease family protein [Candidatus Parcubacteria bacterium]
MARRYKRPADAWEKWSASKLDAACGCPLRCFLEYIMRIRKDRFPVTVFGSAMHYMFQRFFTPHKSSGNYPYQTVEKFLGAWKGFWWTAVQGKHGFSSMGSDPEDVPWRDTDQQGQLFGAGWNILKRFFEEHHAMRIDGNQRFIEKRFTFEWQGLKLTGVLDRLDLLPDGAVILDYKGHSFRPHDVETGLQMTIYQLAYEQHFRRQFADGKPLKDIQIYNYRNGVTQPLPIRQNYEIGLLLYYLTEGYEYYRAILTGHPVRREIIKRFWFFPEDDINTGNITPHLPRGSHCTWCENFKLCRAWELGDHETPQAMFASKFQQEDAQRGPEVITMPFTQERIFQVGCTSFDLIKQVAHVRQGDLFT